LTALWTLFTQPGFEVIIVHTNYFFPEVSVLRRHIPPLTIEMVRNAHICPTIPPRLLRPFCSTLPAPPGLRLGGVPPALIVISTSLHEQGPLGIGHRELGDGERLQCDLMDRSFILIQPFIAAKAIRPARDVD